MSAAKPAPGLLRAEAIASSNIEGLLVNVRGLARSEAAEREGLAVADATARAVLGNIRALDESLARASDPTTPVSLDDLLTIHTALLTGTRDEAWAGVVRGEQNWVGGANPCSAAFVPPPPEELASLLADLLQYMSGDDRPALLQAALAHSQFETIPPFADGNGRAGRTRSCLTSKARAGSGELSHRPALTGPSVAAGVLGDHCRRTHRSHISGDQRRGRTVAPG